jgi:hypothetical protein
MVRAALLHFGVLSSGCRLTLANAKNPFRFSFPAGDRDIKETTFDPLAKITGIFAAGSNPNLPGRAGVPLAYPGWRARTSWLSPAGAQFIASLGAIKFSRASLETYILAEDKQRQRRAQGWDQKPGGCGKLRKGRPQFWFAGKRLTGWSNL